MNDKKSELQRQTVAVNNFLWRTDQLIWRREDVAAGKMLQKAILVSKRMTETPEEMAKELRIRTQLLKEREAILPFLRSIVSSNTLIRYEAYDMCSGPSEDGTWPPKRRFDDELECLLAVRNEVYVKEAKDMLLKKKRSWRTLAFFSSAFPPEEVEV